MKILAIETSCDDTGIAILEVKTPASAKAMAGKGKFTVLSNIVSSQSIHQNYGGVFPMMAKREHQTNLIPVLMRALKQAKLLNPKSQSPMSNEKQKNLEKILEKENMLFESVKEFLEKYEKPKVDMIAVTHGPGLEPCLWVGVNFAKVLSYIWDIPVIPVNHIEGHILVNFLPKINENHKSPAKRRGSLGRQNTNYKTLFPAIALVVSGGHTQLILVKKIGNYEILGETRDDAAGECFDKCAKILGLGYPGGPEIARISSIARSDLAIKKLQGLTLQLPRPMMHSKDYDFSFSGLKTAVLYKVREKYGETPLRQGFAGSDNFVSEMCVEVQQAIIDVLLKKTMAAAKDYNVKTIILGGGVSANQELRKQLQEKISKEIPNTNYLIPDTALSTDNALMIAVAGYFNNHKEVDWQKIEVDANLRIS